MTAGPVQAELDAGSSNVTENVAVELGGTYYISTTGLDSNPGTLAEPFATIQHAVDLAEPGSTLTVRGGTYREAIDLAGLAGTSNAPITLTAYNGETVTLDGTVAITNRWVLDTNAVYKTTLSQDVTQLFVDGQIMTLARFPNARVWSDEMWTARTKKLTGSTRGNIVGADIVASAGVSFKGCIGLFNFGNYATIASFVTQHTAGTNTFKYSPSAGIWRTSDDYFFEGGSNNAERVMLDTTQEWAYDESTKTLYLWPDDGLDPSGRTIAGKVQTYALTGDATTQYIVIDGLNFFATAFKLISSDGVTIRNCTFEYPSCSDRAIGSIDSPETAQVTGTADDFCENFTLYNNTFRYSDGAAFLGSFLENSRIENNLFRDVNYTCVISAAVQASSTRNLVLRRNTLIDAGPYAGFRYGRYTGDEALYPYTLEYNYTEGCSRLQDDGTAYYSANGGVVGSVTRFNWAYDNRERDFRWDGAEDPPEAIQANLYRNVSLSTQNKPVNLIGGAYKLKGDYHEIYNNIAVQGRGDFEVSIEKGGNANSLTYNNAGDYLSGNNDGAAVPGTNSNNYAGQNEPRSMGLLLRDPYHFDFRPKADAVELVDQGEPVMCEINGETVDVTANYKGAAPDIGAYEYGDENYTIPGYQSAQASTPYPEDGRTNALYDTDLMWLGGLDAVSYEVYLGTASNTLALAGSQTNNIFNPGGWTNDQTWCWRIDSVQADYSVVTGEVWSFTISDHTPRAISSRVVVTEDTSQAVVLSGYDPDENTLSYTVTTQPSHGTLSGTQPNLVYMPDTNYFGTDSLLYTVNTDETTSTAAIVLFTVDGVNDDAPCFSADRLDAATAIQGTAYTDSIASWATDPDDDLLTYAVLSGPAWLSVSSGGTLSGTPSRANLGVNSWTVEVADPTGLSAMATLEIRVAEGDLTTLNFADLDTSTPSNSLTVEGSSSNLTVSGGADGSDYLYSVTYTGTDYDGDSLSDTLAFDVRVKGWSGGTTDAGLDVAGSCNTASATIGTTASSVVFTDSTFAVGDINMNNGESLEFMLENLVVSLTDASRLGNGVSLGFTSARLEQTSTTGNSHQAVFGSGTGLLGVDFDTNKESGTLAVGTGSLYISADLGDGTRSTRWGVANVDFDIEIEVVPVGSYSAWAFGYELEDEDFLPSGDPENDGAGDGYNNLMEYALGMNPTLSDAGSGGRICFTTEDGTNWFEYVHSRRTDYVAQGLSYLLIDCTNLLDSVRTTNTQDQILVGPAVGDYESVTNRYKANVPTKFIQLKIRQD
jgi:hypothetical protein